MALRSINTREEYVEALAEISRLWYTVVPGTPEGDEFEALATLVDEYEREHFPILAPNHNP